MALDFVKVGPFVRMKVRIVQGVVVNGRPHDVGEIADVSASDGMLLLSMGRGERFVEPVVPEPVVPESAVVIPVAEVAAESKKKGKTT